MFIRIYLFLNSPACDAWVIYGFYQMIAHRDFNLHKTWPKSRILPPNLNNNWMTVMIVRSRHVTGWTTLRLVGGRTQDLDPIRCYPLSFVGEWWICIGSYSGNAPVKYIQSLTYFHDECARAAVYDRFNVNFLSRHFSPNILPDLPCKKLTVCLHKCLEF